MKKCVKWGIFSFLCVVLSTGLMSCNGDDLNYDDVVPPTVTLKHSVSGRVTGMDGNPIVATVTMGADRYETEADGTFVFEDVKVGTYTLLVEAVNKLPKEIEVTVAETGVDANPVWNIALSSVGVLIEVKDDGSVDGSVTSETIVDNEEAEIEVTVTAPENAVPAGTTIVITPIYTEEEAIAVTKASSESVMLIGTNVSCSDENVQLNEPIALTYDIETEVAANIVAQKLVNGVWVDAEYTVDGDKVTVVADQFTSYSLLFGATITTSTSSEPLVFARDLWDNLYGSNRINTGEATYTYKIGTEISTAGTNRVTAYLIEILARIAGATSTTATGTYPLNVSLPIGTALQISGQQAVKTVTVSSLNRSVSGKQYDGVSVVVRTWNRDHTGSGSLM